MLGRAKTENKLSVLWFEHLSGSAQAIKQGGGVPKVILEKDESSREIVDTKY